MKLLFKKEADYYMRKGTELKIICHGWGYNSVVQYLPNMYEALGSIPSSEKKKWCQFLFYFGNVPGFSKQIIHQKPHSQMCSLIEDT